MTRNFPRGAFSSMSFVTVLPPAICYPINSRIPKASIGYRYQDNHTQMTMRWQNSIAMPALFTDD